MKKLTSLVLGMSVLVLVSACSNRDDGPRIYHDVLMQDAGVSGSYPAGAGGRKMPVTYAYTTPDGEVDITRFSGGGVQYAPPKTGGHKHRAYEAHSDMPPTYSDGSIDVYLPWAAQEAERALRDSMDSEPVAVVKPVVTEEAKPARGGSDRAAKVYFGHGVKNPDGKAKKLLGRFSEGIKKHDHPIEVTGYASSRADIKDQKERQIANLKTSLDRAFVVSSDLIRKGVPADTIKTSAWGESYPAESEEKSRRVEITSRLGQ